MASAFTDALMASVQSSLDPMNGVTREYIGTMVTKQKSDMVVDIANGVESIEQKLTAAKARDAAPAVINCYEKLLGSLNALAS